MASTEIVELQYSNIGSNPSPQKSSVLGNNTTTSTTTSLTISKPDEEEEKKSIIVNNNDNSNNDNTLFGDLPQQDIFIDANDDMTEMEPVDTATNRESLHLIYNSSIDIWCFCFCIKSNRFSNLMEQFIYKLKLKIDLWLKNKKHFGVCRFVTISVLIWMLVSIFFGFCLFITITSISCFIKEYEWNNNEMCLIKSYQINELIINNCSTYIYQINIINSTQCPLINNYKIFNVSVTVNCQSQNDIYTINNTYQCYLNSCNDNQIHFEYYTFDYWYCGWLPLILGIILFCVGQCCIINMKQFCCSNLCGNL